MQEKIVDIIYTANATDDLKYWKKSKPKFIERINRLLEDIKKHPFKGLGNPEPLKFEKSGYWSRRINQEHRLVYKIASNTIYVAQCRYYY